MERVSEILSEKLFGQDESALEMERRETFRRTSAEWAGPEDDPDDESTPKQVRCRICYEQMRRVDAFKTADEKFYCGACRKQMDDEANGE